MPHDWRTDRGDAARTVLTIVNDQSAYTRAADGRVVRRWTPGSFVTSLVECMLRADSTNLALLGIGFPAWAECIVAYKAPGGMTRLRNIAGWSDEGADHLRLQRKD